MTASAQTVRQIALQQPSSIRVFESFGIDYCCGGRKPLAQACVDRGLLLDQVLQALESAAAAPPPASEDWQKASLEELTSHIVASHHAYVTAELPRLTILAEKVVNRHAPTHPELTRIQSALANLADELMQHLAKEEVVLFPYIGKLERFAAGTAPMPSGCFGTVANPIAMMTREHDAAGELVAEMRTLSSGFVPPPDSCPTFHAFYSGLHDFEKDLHQHIHLENNILFPRAIELEAASAAVQQHVSA